MFKNCKFCKSKLEDGFSGKCLKCDARHFRAGRIFHINFKVAYNDMNYIVSYKYERKNKMIMRVSKGPIHGYAVEYNPILFIEGLDKFELTPKNFGKRIGVLVLFS